MLNVNKNQEKGFKKKKGQNGQKDDLFNSCSECSIYINEYNLIILIKFCRRNRSVKG